MDQTDFEQMRRTMVSNQLRPNAVSDSRVVALMGTVSRENFVPEEWKATAYTDREIPVGHGRSLNTPMATGRLLTEAQIEKYDRVLLIGASTGYTAALLAGLAAHVTALEEDPDLLARARANVGDLANVELVEGRLNQGWAAGAPYDLIFIDGAVEDVPQAIIAQLSEQGRLATGLMDESVSRLAIGRRGGTGFGVTAFADADAAILPGFSKPRGFTF